MDYKEKRLQEFREKFLKTMDIKTEQEAEAFLSETIEEMQANIKIFEACEIMTEEQKVRWKGELYKCVLDDLDTKIMSSMIEEGAVEYERKNIPHGEEVRAIVKAWMPIKPKFGKEEDEKI